MGGTQNDREDEENARPSSESEFDKDEPEDDNTWKMIITSAFYNRVIKKNF